MTTRLAIVGGLLVALFGCAPPAWVRTGSRISEASVEKLVPGETMKASLFASLGMPAAVVGPGEKVMLQDARTLHAGLRRHAPVQARDSDTFFELFRGRAPFSKWHRVYYYFEATSVEFFWFLPSITHSSTQARRVWALVDEETGVVQDLVFREN